MGKLNRSLSLLAGLAVAGSALVASTGASQASIYTLSVVDPAKGMGIGPFGTIEVIDNGASQAVALWNPIDLGYSAIYLAHDLAVKKEKAKPVRLVKPWSLLEDLKPEQKEQINKIHTDTLAEKKKLDDKEEAELALKKKAHKAVPNSV